MDNICKKNSNLVNFSDFEPKRRFSSVVLDDFELKEASANTGFDNFDHTMNDIEEAGSATTYSSDEYYEK